MKAFFDTNVYINTFFKTILPREKLIEFFDLYEIVICPIVKHELLLGTIHPKTFRELERFFHRCPILEAPDFEMWEETTEIMKVLKWRENKQQNDVLIALTARKEQATLITYDRHFLQLEDLIKFHLILLKEQ